MITCSCCGSSWSSDHSVAKCPFCNHVIVSKSTQTTYSDMLMLLSDVKQEYGIEIFKNALKLKGILKDKAPELKKEIDLFGLAMKSGLYSDSFTHIGEQNYYTVLQKNRHILAETYYLSETGSSKITEWYCCLLEIDSAPTKPRPAEKPAGFSVGLRIRQAVKNNRIVSPGGKESANDGEYHIAFHPKKQKNAVSPVGQPFPKIDGEYHFCYKKSKH